MVIFIILLIVAFVGIVGICIFSVWQNAKTEEDPTMHKVSTISAVCFTILAISCVISLAL